MTTHGVHQIPDHAVRRKGTLVGGQLRHPAVEPGLPSLCDLRVDVGREDAGSRTSLAVTILEIMFS